MGTPTYGHCFCCTGTFSYSLDQYPERAPTACVPCRNRAGLCLHNVGARREFSPVLFHYSVPHGDDSGATTPETCTWCAARK